MAATGWKARGAAVAELGAVFASLFGISLLIAMLVVPLLPSEAAMPVQALGLWGAVFVGGLLLRREGGSYGDLGFKRPQSWSRTIAWAAATIVVSFGAAAAVGAIITATTDWPPLDVSYIRSSIEGNPGIYLLWLVLVVWGTAAFGEELTARGFIMDRLRRLFGGDRFAIVLAALGQAAIFGLLHAIQGPTGMVITGVIGLVMAGSYFASGRNLWAPILAHGIIDTISLTLMFLGVELPGASS
jgi:uncharacterized protein